MEHYDFKPTPCIFYPRLSKQLNIKLWVKHDDYFELAGGGNKARKLFYIFNAAKKKSFDAVVTAGGLQSNHIRATAIMCAQHGWQSIMVVHAKKPKEKYFEGNLKIAKLCGSKINFVSKDNVAQAMDKAMENLKNKGFNPYYIWGGGHCIEGSFAYYEAIKELKDQLEPQNYPDYIFVASGTGTTQAGIVAGCNKYLPKTKVVGISIARDKERGTKIIEDSLNKLNTFLGVISRKKTPIIFDDTFIGEGYESVYSNLLEKIKWSATNGLILDPTYTGKAFLGMMDYLDKGLVSKNSKILFWHTGGLLNLMADKKI